MCTVVFIPGADNIYIASLRDENPLRVAALPPELITGGTMQYLAPIDPLGNGTWIGVNELGSVIVLLNGAFENHHKKDNYVKSRGAIVSELLQSEMPVVEWNLMKMEDIEPYTLVVFNDNNLSELVWDGKDKHKRRLKNNQNHIWSSSTLYGPEAKLKREEIFNNWIAIQAPIDKHSLFNFFNNYSDPINGYIINRSETLKTLSYSFVELKSNSSSEFNYHDLQASKHYCQNIKHIDNKTSAFRCSV